MKTSDATVHVVDDDAGVRKSIVMLMESAAVPVQAYASAEEFLEALDPGKPGCIVLDLRMPGMDGVQLLQRLREDNCQIPVVVISGHADVAVTVRSMKLGAIDLLQKPFEPEALLATVHKAMQDSIAMHAQQGETDAIRKRFEQLTTRERDLLKLIVAGRSNKQIARDLNISIKTVANHRASVMAKTQASNAADLARLSTAAGILPTDPPPGA